MGVKISDGRLEARAAGVVMWPTAAAVGEGLSPMRTFSPVRGGIRAADFARGAIFGPMSPLPGVKRYGETWHPTACAVGHMTPPQTRLHVGLKSLG